MQVVLQMLVAPAHSHLAISLLAYIDPSTGSLVFQVIAASVISAGLFVTGLRNRLVWLLTAGWRSKLPSNASPIDVSADTANDAAS
ncbi:MAG TPA: hypothetical protein VFE46_19980 [Pirellulales bacterium]|jgi:hypothetical protein|nr:hypothetical protein [Pirellulales bacterium]